MAFRAAMLLMLMGIVVADFEEMRKKRHAARMCHKSCGKDVTCHKNCPKPRKILVEACRQTPTIVACHKRCAGDVACAKNCPTFPMDWLQKKFEADPERFVKRSEKICPWLEKAHACHMACVPGDFECHHKCPRAWKHHGKHGLHHAHGQKNNGVRPDAKGCYDKGEHGVWCPKGDDWYCVKNCKDELKRDANGCYDKGEHGVWCPKGDDWYCVKNCKDELKPDANGCYDKGADGVWCPKGDDWYCVKNCKEEKPAPGLFAAIVNKGSTVMALFHEKIKAFVPSFSNVKTVVV